MSDEVFYSNGFLRDLARKRMKQVEAEKKAQEKAQEKTAQQMWDEMPDPPSNSDWDAPTHGNTILDELAGAVEGYAASGGELPAFICLDENGRFWLSSDVGGGGASTAAFHATLRHNREESRYEITVLPGTAQVVGYDSLELAPPSQNIPDSTVGVSYWVWLEWKRSGANQTSNIWSVHYSFDSATATIPTMSGDLNVPLFKFWIANGEAHLVQYVEGSILLPDTVNALDVDVSQ